MENKEIAVNNHDVDRVIIFGTGSVAEHFLNVLDKEKIEIIAFCNSDPSIKEFHNVPCMIPEKIHSCDFDYILIASGNVEKITDMLVNLGISTDRIVSFIYDESDTYIWMADTIRKEIDKRYKRSVVDKWLKQDKILPNFYPAVIWDAERNISVFRKDFVREQTLRLLAESINTKGINGAIAELGVYKGDFTVCIDEVFPNRDLYIFDTFDGFEESDLEDDSSIQNKIGEKAKFKDTSPEYVLGRLINPSRVVVKKGYFPESFDLTDVTFSFVSIDLNVYGPVKSALEIFYPLLVKGGYILVSDYYSPYYHGTKKAVDEWCSENDVTATPVSDFYGSVLIAK